MDFVDKKILITGGLGLTGSNLTRRLVNLGAKISILTKSLKNEDSIKDIKENVEIVIGDVSNYDEIEKNIKEKDFIFHLAGQNSVPVSMDDPFLDLRVNAKSTLNILEACKKYNTNVKIIFSGTIREVGPIENKYVKENQYENPTSIFDLHKLTSEKYLRIYNKVHGLKTTTLRFSNVFGVGIRNTDIHASVINYFIKKALIDKKLEVYGDDGPLRDYNYVENVVDALLAVAENDNTNGEYYVLGSGEGNSFKDFLDKLQSILEEKGVEININKVETPEVVSKTVQGDVIVDYSKLNKDSNWKPKINFEEGLRKTIDFYQSILGN